MHTSSRSARGESPSVGIVGAGISGLAAARSLQDFGMRVTVFDRGRRPGGRASSRRRGDWQFDHGAQYFTARDERFWLLVRSWIDAGVVRKWNGRFGVATGGEIEAKESSVDRYVGVPQMQSLASHLARALDVRTGVDVSRIQPHGGKWLLADAGGGELGRFDVAIAAVPPAQALGLLGRDSSLSPRLSRISLQACWATLLVYAERLDVDVDGLFMNGGALSWAARDSSKPGRPDGERWVLHATPAWSEDRIDADAGAVARAMTLAFHEETGVPNPAILHSEGHRWRYALAADPLSSGCLWDGEGGLGVCGDWANGSRIEGAFLSGVSVAGHVIEAAG